MGEGRTEQEGEAVGDEKRRSTLHDKSWRFAYEALTHVLSLRLFLFNSVTSTPLKCVSLRAYLLPTSPFSSSPVVVCTWRSPDGDSHSVYVPMPFCIIDHSAPFSAVAFNDHIEVKLKLLPFGGSFLDGLTFLGFSHRGVPIKRDGGDTVKRDEAPFSLSSDAELLAKKRSLSIYCRNCSAKLTRRPLSRVQDLPSSDWRELAEHWFGTCCCGNSVRTASSLSKFEQFLTPARGACLVGSTTCIVHPNDLATDATDEQDEHVSLCTDIDFKESGGAVSGPVEVTPELAHQIGDAGSNENASSALESKGGTVVLGSSPAMVKGDGASLGIGGATSASADEAADDSYRPGIEKTAEHSLCGDSCSSQHREAKQGELSKQSPSENVKLTRIPASAFMSGPWAADSSSSWTPVNCHSCSCLVGASSGGDGEGVQLFKCHISTDACPGESSDVFRYHTLDRVFCNELLGNTEDNSSYRYVIRGLNSKALLLQLVVVNHESWNCSGSCLGELSFASDSGSAESLAKEASMRDDADPECELMVGVGKEEFPPAFLEPVMKVMFRDGSSFSPDELSAAEVWAREQEADDIYMLESEAKSLADSLQNNKKLFPESAASFQQFDIAFLAR